MNAPELLVIDWSASLRGLPHDAVHPIVHELEALFADGTSIERTCLTTAIQVEGKLASLGPLKTADFARVYRAIGAIEPPGKSTPSLRSGLFAERVDGKMFITEQGAYVAVGTEVAKQKSALWCVAACRPPPRPPPPPPRPARPAIACIISDLLPTQHVGRSAARRKSTR
jgi:hypothetical protein